MAGEQGNTSIETLQSQNQLLLMTQDAFYWILHIVVDFSLLTAHYLTLPYIFFFGFLSYATDQLWQIATGIFVELKTVMSIVPLIIQISFYSTLLTVQTVMLIKTAEEVAIEVEKRIYEPLKLILRTLKIDFSDTKHAIALFGFFKNLRIFGNRLPFPLFLFRKIFKNVIFRKRVITIIVDPPEDKNLPTGSDESIRTTRKKSVPKLSSTQEEKGEIIIEDKPESDL